MTTPANTPHSTDADNRYKTVQHKLTKLAQAMDQASSELGRLHLSMRTNADHTSGVAGAIARADFDPKYVEMTNLVSVALGGAAAEVRKLNDNAQDVASNTHKAKKTHADLYGALDEIRSGRREKTPKPGAFVN